MLPTLDTLQAQKTELIRTMLHAYWTGEMRKDEFSLFARTVASLIEDLDYRQNRPQIRLCGSVVQDAASAGETAPAQTVLARRDAVPGLMPAGVIRTEMPMLRRAQPKKPRAA